MKWFRRHRKTLTLALALSGLFFMLGFFKRYHVPQLKRWLLVEIEEASRKQSPVAIRAKKLDLHLFPLGGTFYEVSLTPNGSFALRLRPTEVQEVQVSLSTWGLLKGQIILGEVRAKGTTLSMTMNSEINTSKGRTAIEQAKDFQLEDIYALPIEKIRLQDVKLALTAPKNGLSGAAIVSNLTIENRYDSIRLSLLMNDLLVSKAGVTSIFTADVETQLLVDSEGVYLSQLRVTRGESKLLASGSLVGDILNQRLKSLRAKAEGSVDLQGLRAMAADLANTQLPLMSGRLGFDADLVHTFGGDTNTSFALGAEDLTIKEYDIGNVQTSGRLKNKVLSLPQTKWVGTYGEILSNNFKLDIENGYAFSTELKSGNLAMQPFFRSLGLAGVPVEANVKAHLPCEGQFRPSLNITCKGELLGENFVVHSGLPEKSPIVSFPKFEIAGSVTVDASTVRYKTDLKIGQSKGETEGVISYQDGFKIKYSTPALNFADVSHLANLKPEGVVSLTGSTEGTSQFATIDMRAKGEDLWLSDFFLGRAQWTMQYKASQVSFQKMQGQAGQSTYSADVDVDLNKDSIRLRGTMPFIDAEDILKVVSRKAQLPFLITGTGSAQVSASGPLEFSRLSYQLNSSLYRGSIANESFDQLRFQVTSRGGYVETNEATLTKGRSRLVANGQVNPEGDLKLSVSGRGFQIEQSENLARLKMRLMGNLNFDTQLSGPILSPKVDLSGTITNALLGESSVGDSKFNLRVNGAQISASGDFLGESLSAKLAKGVDNDLNTRLSLTMRQWNFAQTFSIFADTPRTARFQTSVSGELAMVIPEKQPSAFNGDFKLHEFFIRNGSSQLASRGPMSLTAKNGVITADDFELTGESTYVRLTSNVSEGGQNKLAMEGRLDMSLLALFTPFLEDIRGRLGFSVGVTGPLTSPEVSGSVFVESGVFKLKEFPHAFEQIQSDAIFKNGRLIINSIRGRLAGGVLTANGKIDATRVGQVDVDIRGNVDDARMNVPDGFQTRGKGDFSVTGSWFPYTIAVNYTVASGQVDYRTRASATETIEIKPSRYLPKTMGADRISPVVLALDIRVQRALPVKLAITTIDIAVTCDVTGELKITGPPTDPKLTGRIQVNRGGKVAFRANTFEVRGGYVEYANSPPDNPNLNLQADAKVTAQLKNNETRDFDIDLRVQGTAQAPKITVTSQPPLTETELISLLTLGFINETDTDTREVTAGEQLTNTTYQLGSAFINEQLGLNKTLERRLGVRFDINSSYDTTDKAEKHKFTLRKQWTPKFGTSASREIGKTSANNVRAEYKLNKNVSVVAEWEGTQDNTTDKSKTKDGNLLGLDVEYKVDFK